MEILENSLLYKWNLGNFYFSYYFLRMSVIGIDFGNMNTVVAVARHRSIDVISNEVSNRLSPTMVSFEYDTGRRHIGEAAKTLEISKLSSTISQLKRLIMIAAGDILSPTDRETFNVVHGLDLSTGSLSDKATAVQIVAMFFGYIKEISQVALGHSTHVSDCVISVPSFWGDTHRRILSDSASIAGLTPLMLINEGTAASLAFGLSRLDILPPMMTLLMVDIGHSMTQVQLSKLTPSGIQVISNAWDMSLGGRDIDNALADYAAEHFEAEKPKALAGLRSASKAMARLRMACEKAKKVLSASSVAPLSVECLYNDTDVSMTLTRDLLIEIMETKVQFFSRLRKVLDNVLIPTPGQNNSEQQQQYHPDHIEVVGGSTRIPSIKETISAQFNGIPVSTGLNQDEAIARGCAYQCAMLSPVFKVKAFEIKEVNSLSYSISWGDSAQPNQRVVLLEPRTGVPCSRAVSFSYKQLPLTLSLICTNNGSVDFQEHVHARYNLSQEITNKIDDRSHKEGVDNKTLNQVDSTATEESLVLDGIVKLKVRYSSSGMLSFDPRPSLWVPKPTIESSNETGDGVEQYTTITPTTNLVRDTNITLSLSLISCGSLNKEEISRLAGIETQMIAADKALFEADTTRNALEEFIYEKRESLSSTLAPFITGDEEECVLRKALDDSENWLYPIDEVETENQISPQEMAGTAHKRLCLLKDAFYGLIERSHAYDLAMERLSKAIRKAESFGDGIDTLSMTTDQDGEIRPPNTLAVIELAQKLEYIVEQKVSEQQQKEQQQKEQQQKEQQQEQAPSESESMSESTSKGADLD